jgi:hypothetical protein
MEKPQESNQSVKQGDSIAEVKPLELNENALLMGFMADFGRKLTDTIKTDRSAPSENLV